MSRPFTVLHVTEAFGAGVVSSLTEMVGRTPEFEHHLLRKVRATEHTTGEGEAGIAAIYELPHGHLAAVLAVRSAIKRLRPDVVHAHSSYAGVYVRLAASARRVRIVYTPHGYAYLRTDLGRAARSLIRVFESALTWNTSALAACSAHEATLAAGGRRSMERYTVPNVVTIPPTVARTRAERVIVGSGRLLPIRDPLYFLRVVQLVRARRPDVRVRWLGGRHGPAADRLTAAGVEVTGWLPRERLLDELARASVYVHTAAWDGFPMTVLEAVGLDVPTVARRIPQLAECPADVLFDTPEALADELVRELDHPTTVADHRRRWDGFLKDHSPATQRPALLSAYGMPPSMKLLVVDYAGHPFQYDLSMELAGRGHEVVHTYSLSTSTPRAGFETVAGVTVEPVDIGRPFERYRATRRLRDELSYGWRTVSLARRHRPDRILASNVPVFSLAVIWSWAFVSRTPAVLWLQDMQAGLAGLVTGRQGVVARSLGVLERFLIRRSRRVVAISASFAEVIERLGVDRERVTVIENWAPLDSMPLRPRNNEWARRHGLDDSFVVLYSGTIGMKHSPELLKALAEEFADDDGVKVVVVGEGAGADWLREQPEPRPILLPFQPFEDLPDVLASADVLVALLDASAGAFSVPSKTLSYLCAGRPILAAVPRENAAAEIVADRARAGVVVRPEPQAVRDAARALYVATDRDRAGARGRKYALAAFDRRLIGDRFEQLLANIGR